MAERQIPSSEFRVTYARLTEPVAVTALGRVIGYWVPADRGVIDAIRVGDEQLIVLRGVDPTPRSASEQVPGVGPGLIVQERTEAPEGNPRAPQPAAEAGAEGDRFTPGHSRSATGASPRRSTQAVLDAANKVGRKS